MPHLFEMAEPDLAVKIKRKKPTYNLAIYNI